MDTREYLSEIFENDDAKTVKAAEISGAQGRYERLVRALGEIGTQVRFMTVTEDSEWRAPKRCFIKAFHEYIFPSQPDATIDQEESVEYESETKTKMTKKMNRCTFDREKVSGHLGLEYEDLERIHLQVHDEIEDSQIPEEAQRSIDEAFDGY